MTDSDYYAPTYWNAVRHAWHEFVYGVKGQYWSLSDPTWDDEPKLPKWLAALLAPWGPLVGRFSAYNLAVLCSKHT